jgi:hypothetical protein
MSNPDLAIAVAILAPVSVLWTAFACVETARIISELKKDRIP